MTAANVVGDPLVEQLRAALPTVELRQVVAVNLQQQLVGPPNSLRFPAYASLNLGLERKFELRGYLWAVRVEAINILGRQNPDSVVNNVDAPCSNTVRTGCFGAFAGGQGRATILRVRFVGRK